VPLETLVQKFSFMRFEPEGITQNPEIPFAKSMPDYIMRWLASRWLDADQQEEFGILTPTVRARKAAEEAAQSSRVSDTAGPVHEHDADGGQAAGGASNGQGNGHGNGGNGGGGGRARARTGPQAGGGRIQPATAAMTDQPPVVPARLKGFDLGPACGQCGGMMQRTGSCYTCGSCGNNTGCG